LHLLAGRTDDKTQQIRMRTTPLHITNLSVLFNPLIAETAATKNKNILHCIELNNKKQTVYERTVQYLLFELKHFRISSADSINKITLKITIACISVVTLQHFIQGFKS